MFIIVTMVTKVLYPTRIQQSGREQVEPAAITTERTDEEMGNRCVSGCGESGDWGGKKMRGHLVDRGGKAGLRQNGQNKQSQDRNCDSPIIF